MDTEKEEIHTLSILVDNEPGVLSRVAGLFSARGFNIESLCVAATMDDKVSRITLVTRGNNQIQEQINKQLNKLINIIKVIDYEGTEFVEREMALVKAKTSGGHQAEILRIVDIFRCKVVDVTHHEITIEVTGARGKIEALLDLIRPFGIAEIARTGSIALARSKKGKLS
ncbi:MAG: acetolactate synthase small subunit [Deltaproteobacteria bacterium]|nr:acetolactate synthase small subunit [Deltaproteobacteria bacterium]MBF0497706.1 acetolactate synthase small subunit [Deltaproteobacteria bacterium]MBF0526281.1 acetolactate synthase small subunit [Deltaproteobacteria bacterium]